VSKQSSDIDLPVLHFDKICQFEWISQLKICEIYIENKNLN